MAYRNFTEHANIQVPQIQGAKGGKGGGGGEPYEPTEDPQSLFSTDILFVVVGLGEGPVYRINPNGPQDIQLTDSSIDDLINLDGDGLENTQKFKTLSTTGTTVQEGDTWYDTDDDQLKVYRETSSGTFQWVPIIVGAAGGDSDTVDAGSY